MEEFMRVVGQKGLKSHSDLVEELEEAMKVRHSVIHVSNSKRGQDKIGKDDEVDLFQKQRRNIGK